MPIDINIKCVKQKSETINYDEETFFLEKLNEKPTDEVIYNDNWFLYNSIVGVGYNLYLKESQDATYNLVDFKESKQVASYLKHMLRDEKKPSNGTLENNEDSVIFNKNYTKKLENLLMEFINNSKIKTCVLFFRLQTSRPERYVGRISLNQFISMLDREEIYLNTAYIISDADYD